MLLDKPFYLLIITGSVMFLGACVANTPEKKPPDISYLAKTDIDTVADINISESLKHLRTLAKKLYLRNPRELYKHTDTDVDRLLSRLFDKKHDWNFPELGNAKGTACIQLAFDEAFKGDRILAFTVGLSTMIIASYNNKTEFFLFDDLVPQKLYNSARNLEIAVWRLSNARDNQGNLFLLSNSIAGETRNLSYERLFGKLIAQQDTMARIMEQKTQRTIKTIIQSLASAVFLPIQ